MNTPPWLSVARSYLGLKEVPGATHNPKILEWHALTSLGPWGRGRDETPWCSSALCGWMHESGFTHTGSAAAKSWLDWGVEIHAPMVGCVCVFKRKGGHHVALYEADQHKAGPGEIMVIGGNQDNSVCVKAYKTKDLLGYRWPI